MAKKTAKKTTKKSTSKSSKNTQSKNKNTKNTKSSNNTGKKKSKNTKSSKKNTSLELKIMILFLLFIILAMSVHGFPMGILGDSIRALLSGLFSVSMYFIPYFFIAVILIRYMRKLRENRTRYSFALLSLFLAQTLFVGVYSRERLHSLSFADMGEIYTNGKAFIGSGFIGNLIYSPIYSLFGYIGTILLIIALCLVFLLLSSKFSLSEMMKIFGKSIKKTGEKAAEFKRKENKLFVPDGSEEEKMPPVLKSLQSIENEEKHEEYIEQEYIDDEVSIGDEYIEREVAIEKRQANFKFIDIPNSMDDYNQADFMDEDVDSEESVEFRYNLREDSSEDEMIENDYLPEEMETIEEVDSSDDVIEEQQPASNQSPQSSGRELSTDITDDDYILPSLDLLVKGSSAGTYESERDMVNKAAILEETFKSFKVDADVMSAVQGPMITRFEVKPKAGVKISKIASLSDDIAMRLAATNVRILAPIPGKSAVGIEVPNDTVSVVRLRDVLESTAYSKEKSKIKVGLGKDISGGEIVADLAKMPHLLIAGATGSGKSVCVNTIISSILFNAKPSEVKFLMIDPKVVELSVYNGIPHLLLPVVTDPSKASIALNWAVNEMTQRYAKFAEYRVRDINSYNEKYEEWKKEREELEEAVSDIKEHGIMEEDVIPEENAETPDSDSNVVYRVKNEEPEENIMEFMPRIVIIIDELADLMVVAGKQVEESIARIAQMARAAGMHLIVATQRPSVDVITGLIKANIPSRIAFAVSSQIDSRTILDEQGADKLLGKGDMLFLNAGKSKPTRVQGAFVTDNEVEDLVNYVKNQFEGELDYNEDVVDASNIQAFASASDEDKDELLDAAIEFVIKSEKASTSMIQRKFRIGYNRAARIIEEMEERGIVSESRGAKPREVLISAPLWESEKNDA